jgi:hypothetical protein
MHCGQEEEERQVVLTSSFVPLLPTIAILMDQVISVLLHNTNTDI